MKWNTPDWCLGLLAGTLFGLYVAMSFVRIVERSPDARSYIVLFGMLTVIGVRHAVLRKKPPSSTQR